MKCCRYIDAYRIGLSPEQVEFATKKYKSHRSIPPEFIAFLNNPGKWSQESWFKNKVMETNGFWNFGQYRFKAATTV